MHHYLHVLHGRETELDSSAGFIYKNVKKSTWCYIARDNLRGEIYNMRIFCEILRYFRYFNVLYSITVCLVYELEFVYSQLFRPI